MPENSGSADSSGFSSADLISSGAFASTKDGFSCLSFSIPFIKKLQIVQQSIEFRIRKRGSK
ncbi:MAG: hypothetical protein K0S07_93 [Chlamydiales bacterium]|nr:hypothetical protein [Chlamydiales bacterium]